MKKTAKTTLIVSALLISGVALASPFMGHGRGECSDGAHGGMKGMHFGGVEERAMDHLTSKLDLSDAQRDSVRAVIDETRPKMREIRDEMRENREALFSLVQSDDAKDSELRLLAEKQGDYIAEMIVLGAQAKNKMAKTLTEEQRENFKNMHSRHHSEGRHHF